MGMSQPSACPLVSEQQMATFPVSFHPLPSSLPIHFCPQKESNHVINGSVVTLQRQR